MRSLALAVGMLAVAACAVHHEEPPALQPHDGVQPTHPHGDPCVRAGRACTDMYFVAHEDDDLLFMNPDIARSIAAGNHVVIVHMTTGDLPAASVATLADQPDPVDFTRYWIDRERGILNAYTAMALGDDAAFSAYPGADAVPTGWQLVTDPGSSSSITVDGVEMSAYELVGSRGQTVSAVFMRLSDFQLDQAWANAPGTGGQHGGVMLAAGETMTDECDDPSPCPLGTTIPSQVLTREQLLASLAGLITRFAPDSVSAQDATTPITTGTAMFWDVLGTPRSGIGPNSGYTDYWDHIYGAAFVMAAATRAQAAMTTTVAVRLYRGYTSSQEPPNLDEGEALAKAQVFARYTLFDASIQPHGEHQDYRWPIFPSGDYSIDSPGSWEHRQIATRTLLATGQLQGRLAVMGNCLGVANGAPAYVSCNVAPAWIVTATNQLQAAGSNACLTVNADDPSGAIALAPCAPQTTASTLFLFANGQLRGADAKCVAIAGTTLASVDCEGEPLAPHATGIVLASQDFTLLFDPAQLISESFPGMSPSVVREHACVRDSGGVECAAFADGVLGPMTLLATLPDAADSVSAQWDPVAGALVACSRDAGDLTCGARTSSSFADSSVIRYADLGGRGRIDVCGRGAAGITCALDSGDAWASSRPWTSRFSDADGWLDAAYGHTVQFADVDGDGMLDVCGRSAGGIECSTQTADGHFSGDAQWTFDENRSNDLTELARDFSDLDPTEAWRAAPDYYESFRLVDVNHDGLADICARGEAGIYCAFSTGTTFERRKLVAIDAASWGVTIGSLAWGNLESAQRVDVCGTSSAGLVCAVGY